MSRASYMSRGARASSAAAPAMASPQDLHQQLSQLRTKYGMGPGTSPARRTTAGTSVTAATASTPPQPCFSPPRAVDTSPGFSEASRTAALEVELHRAESELARLSVELDHAGVREREAVSEARRVSTQLAETERELRRTSTSFAADMSTLEHRAVVEGQRAADEAETWRSKYLLQCDVRSKSEAEVARLQTALEQEAAERKEVTARLAETTKLLAAYREQQPNAVMDRMVERLEESIRFYQERCREWQSKHNTAAHFVREREREKSLVESRLASAQVQIAELEAELDNMRSGRERDTHVPVVVREQLQSALKRAEQSVARVEHLERMLEISEQQRRELAAAPAPEPSTAELDAAVEMATRQVRAMRDRTDAMSREHADEMAQARDAVAQAERELSAQRNTIQAQRNELADVRTKLRLAEKQAQQAQHMPQHAPLQGSPAALSGVRSSSGVSPTASGAGDDRVRMRRMKRAVDEMKAKCKLVGKNLENLKVRYMEKARENEDMMERMEEMETNVVELAQRYNALLEAAEAAGVEEPVLEEEVADLPRTKTGSLDVSKITGTGIKVVPLLSDLLAGTIKRGSSAAALQKMDTPREIVVLLRSVEDIIGGKTPRISTDVSDLKLDTDTPLPAATRASYAVPSPVHATVSLRMPHERASPRRTYADELASPIAHVAPPKSAAVGELFTRGTPGQHVPRLPRATSSERLVPVLPLRRASSQLSAIMEDKAADVPLAAMGRDVSPSSSAASSPRHRHSHHAHHAHHTTTTTTTKRSSASSQYSASKRLSENVDKLLSMFSPQSSQQNSARHASASKVGGVRTYHTTASPRGYWPPQSAASSTASSPRDF